MRGNENGYEDKHDFTEKNGDFPDAGILLIRLEEESVGFPNGSLISCPKGKDAQRDKQTNDNGWDSNRKCPSKMFMLPAFHINIVNEVIFWIFNGGIIPATN